MQNEDYIGKPLSDCPDGTVAVVIPQGADSACVRMLNNGEPWWVGEDFALLSDDGGDPSSYTVLAIIRLGKPEPRTFADVPPGEAWLDHDGLIHWKDDSDEMCYLDCSGVPSPNYPQEAKAYSLTEGNWTRLGPIEGIVIGGKVYGKDATDE